MSERPYDPAWPGVASPASVRKSVSPPPLKHKEPVQGKLTTHTGSPSTPGKLHTPVVSSANPSPARHDAKAASTSAAPAAQKPSRKPESLNPRLLQSSPASHEHRFKLLKLLHAEYVRLNNELKKDRDPKIKSLVLSDQELIWLALDEEQRIATGNRLVYGNIIKNFIMKYKRMDAAKWKAERLEKKKAALPKGPQEKKPPTIVETGLTPAQEVELLSRLITPITNLGQFNYVSSVPSPDDIQKAMQGVEAAQGWERCDRCEKRFQVFPGRRLEDGKLTSGGECTFHWGKMYFLERQAGDKSGSQEKRYRCCGQAVGDSAGCTTSPTHVWKTTDPKRLALVLNFAETPENPLAPTDRAVAFDCEMCYTVKGLELIRLTATSWPTGEELLDVLVQPIGEILDLNSRFSGVWPEDFDNAEQWSAKKPQPAPQPSGARKKMQMVSSPEVARDLLFSLISPATPLIGHGLENDLNAVRVVHPRVVDTVLLFPHKRGLPIRHGLKMLMETKLNRQIQVESGADGKVQGHDSAEDARAAGDLVRLKVKEEWERMKSQGWKLVDGDFVAPIEKDKDGGLTEAFLEGRQSKSA
ncbi:RNA exonuclease 3-like protein 2 [Pleurostoma richardsiae]|uniref:RNA exonuclease 3-like protein 2 n=1 Tax=Pleurostoma richardsiae TaxID=41990 RepID=A0AA38RTY6_9PEZI|nr:RNA exonuclease 3-like protein 2 [Pleurostoma richardsiae]